MRDYTHQFMLVCIRFSIHVSMLARIRIAHMLTIVCIYYTIEL